MRHGTNFVSIVHSCFSGGKPWLFSFLCLVFFTSYQAAFAQTAERQSETSESFAALCMGTLVQGTVYAKTHDKAGELAQKAVEALRHYEALFTVHARGPLQSVNEKAGEWVSIDCEAADLVQRARDLAQDSARAFEPTIGTVVNVWKIGFGGKEEPKSGEIREALRHVDYRQIQTERPQGGACRVKIGAGQSIDLGAIAKGWIGTRLTEILRDAGATRAMLDLGGNVALLGDSPRGSEWRIGIQNPRGDRGDILAVVTARNESVITSGDYERYFLQNGKVYGHILSAKTGYPVPMSMSSVTIVDADGAAADGWCTALFAMGLDEALKFVKAHPAMKVFIVQAGQKKAYVSRSLAERLSLTDEKIALTVIE